MTTTSLPTQSSAEKVTWLNRPIWKRLTRAHLILAAIMLLAAFFHFYNINSIGDANAYYTAAVKSMLQSWHNFFFIAAEPGGSVTIDKPPLGLWIEAAFAAVLGVSGFSVSLPNILAGIFGIPVLYKLVKKYAGTLAGLVAAFVMAITPIFVATNRNNTMDGLLVFCLLLAAWAFIKATESGKLRWLLLGGIIVGLGFNIKMMQAFLPLPAFYALYFFGSKVKWGRKLFYLLLTTIILLVVSLSWTVIVDLTPADQRPYIGSSTDNTVMGLLIEHNGLSRLESNKGPKTDNPQKGDMPANNPQAGINPDQDSQIQPGSRQVPPAEAVFACENSTLDTSCSFTTKNGNTVNGSCINAPNSNSLVCAPQGMIPQNGQTPAGQPPAGGQNLNDGPIVQGGGTPFNNETGDPGLLRFFTSPLSKQMSWLLPFALISVLLAALSSKIKLPIESGIHKVLVLWGGWLLTCVVFFSIVSGIFHSYYAIMLAPALGAMVGIGFSQLWSWKDTKWAGVVLAVSAAATIGYQFFAASQYGEFSWWLLAVGLLLGLGFLLLAFKKRLAYFVLLASMMVIPFYWTAMTVGTNANQNLPTAYEGSTSLSVNAAPVSQRPDGGQAGFNRNTDLIDYLVSNTQDVDYLVAVPSSQQGAVMVLATGRPVLYMGGFNGGDDVVNADDLSAMTVSGELRYVYYGDNGKADITRWLQSTCSVVSQFSQSTTNRPVNAVQGPNDQTMTLYMCQ